MEGELSYIQLIQVPPPPSLPGKTMGCVFVFVYFVFSVYVPFDLIRTSFVSDLIISPSYRIKTFSSIPQKINENEKEKDPNGTIKRINCMYAPQPQDTARRIQALF